MDDAPCGGHPALLRLRPAALPALAALAQAGVTLLVLTDSSGPWTDAFTRRWFVSLQRGQAPCMRDEADVQGLAVPARPRAPGAGETPGVWCRRRLPGLITPVARQYRLDLVGWWLVGTAQADLEIGRRAGCPSILLEKWPRDLVAARAGFSAPCPFAGMGRSGPPHPERSFPGAPSLCPRRAVLPTGGMKIMRRPGPPHVRCRTDKAKEPSYARFRAMQSSHQVS